MIDLDNPDDAPVAWTADNYVGFADGLWYSVERHGETWLCRVSDEVTGTPVALFTAGSAAECQRGVEFRHADYIERRRMMLDRITDLVG